MLAGERIFTINFYRHLNRGPEGPRDLRAQDDELPNPDGMEKVQVVHRNRYDHSARMALSGNRSSKVDQAHHLAAQNVAPRVGIARQNNFQHFNPRLADYLAVS